MGRTEIFTGFGGGNLRKEQLGSLDIDGRITLKM
jgi:hypothetical protein